MQIRVPSRHRVGVKEQRISVDPNARTLRAKLESGHVTCQRGAAPRGGKSCIGCVHMVETFPASPDELVVRCGWDGRDPVRDVMTLPPAWVALASDANVGAARSLVFAGAEYVLVVERGALLGIVTAHDLRGDDQEPVRAIMSTSFVAVPPETSLSRCADMLAHRDVACLAVVEGHQLLGVLGALDLASIGML